MQKAEQKLYEKSLDKEYLPIVGLSEFCVSAAKLAFGDESFVHKTGRNATVQVSCMKRLPYQAKKHDTHDPSLDMFAKWGEEPSIDPANVFRESLERDR